eukprot:SAG31_NODE_17405_length_672_cov_0.640489_1_plen_223_part_11
MVYQHIILHADVNILDTNRKTWIRPSVDGEPPRGRADMSSWLIPGKNRFLVTLGDQARDADRIWVLEWAAQLPLAAATWTRVLETSGVPPYPSFEATAVSQHTACFVPKRATQPQIQSTHQYQLVVLGGKTTPLASIRDPLRSLALDGRTLEYEQLSIDGTPPYARYGHTATLVDGEVIVVAGGHCRAAARQDVFMLDRRTALGQRRAAGSDATHTWRQVRPV